MTAPTVPAVGDTVPPLRVDAVEADKIRIMALVLQDPNPIHFDLAAVRAAGLGDREVNQGGVTMAYVINMLAAWTGSRAAVRAVDCRFAANVFAGDAVDLGGTVTAVRAVDGEHLVDCEVWADRGDGVRAVAGTATVAF
ncbi:MaoC family dehydratase [Pseudonocardia pini]|uniref:MaoC family dehydratase n=1 Tax=Pseudonocardia pini TaxID=2758030 RepID=UPI0015F0A06D|nr:MaoC/PaaZ C-terminal domain-containing protein [Pseudonocardia pini]